MKTGRQSKKAARTRSDGKGVKVSAKSLPNVKDVADASLAASGAVQVIAESAFRVAKVDIRESTASIVF